MPDEAPVDAPADAPEASGRRRRRLLPAPVWHIGKLLVVALIVEYLVLPQIAGTRKTLHLLSTVSPLYLLAGFGLEVLALLAYAQLTRTVIPEGSDVGLFTMLRIQLTTLSISHCVPGGTAAGSSLGYRLLTVAGVGKTDVGFALAAQGMGSAVVLNIILWLALVVSIPVWGFSPLYLAAAVAGGLLILVFVILVLLLTRGASWVATVVERAAARLPFVDEATLRSLVERLAGRLQELSHEPARLVRAVAWAAANWLLDAGSLYFFVAAFGHWTNPDGLLVAYGLAYVLAAIPLTPGGLGLVEATLTSTLVGFNTPRGVAILGVVGYRLVNFWLPIPLGGLAYLSLQVRPGHAGPRPGIWARLSGRRSSPVVAPPVPATRQPVGPAQPAIHEPVGGPAVTRRAGTD